MFYLFVGDVYVVSLAFGSEPVPSQTPHEDAMQLVTEFQSEYGNQHPEFLITSYEEARWDGGNASS